MSMLGRLTGARASRVVWGLLALLLLAGLLLSVSMAGRALTDEKRAAEQRAEFLTNTVLFNALTPGIVSNVIFGPEYRSLIITVQGQILADSAIGPDAVAQVRIWRPDGTLIFSTAQRDKIGEFVASGNPQIEQALNGRTVSLLTDAQVAPKAGLQGSQERLYETFVPLHLPNQIGVLAAVQIDTRYSAITAAAGRVWRPVELGLLLALLLVAILFVTSLRRPPAVEPVEAAENAPVTDLAEADRRVRAAENAAAQAAEESRKTEEVAKQYQEKLATSEQRLRDTIAASRGLESDVKEATTRIPALEAELQRLRDQAVSPPEPSEAEVGAKAEVSRLAAALKDSELERDKATQEVRRVLDSVAALEAEAAKLKEQLAQSEGARATLETQAKRAAAEAKKAKDATGESPSDELSKARSDLAEREAELVKVRGDLAAKDAEAAQAVRAKQDEEAKSKSAKAELEAAEARAATSASRVAELEAAAAKVSELEPKVAKVSELEARVRELEELRRKEVTDLQTAQERLANSQAELIASTKRAKDLEGDLKRALATTAEGPAAAAAPAGGGAGAYEEPPYEHSTTLAERLSQLSHKPEEIPAEAEAGEEEVAADAGRSEEGESLRTRLARAAAARHRSSPPPPRSSS